MNFKCEMSFRKLPIGNLIFENIYKCQEKMALCGRNEWRKFGNYLPVTQSDVNLWYIERLSKKSKNGDFSNFACNKINDLQASNSPI